MDLELIAARLGVGREDIERVERLAGERRPAVLPGKNSAPEVLGRLGVGAQDTAEILTGWPEDGSPLWTDELRWLLDRSVALVRADLGGYGWLVPGPELPRGRGVAWRHLYVYAFLALIDDVMGYHRAHGVPEAVSWATLADLGRNLEVDRRMRGEGWPVMQSWLTLHWRGGVYELGRLQHQRGGVGDVDLHVPDSGPLTLAAVDASLDEAQAFFPRHFPDEHYMHFACGSWLLDPQLLEFLPETSNIVRFQRRFELEPYEEPEGIDADVEVRRFVFRDLSTPLELLPQDTALRRAVVRHFQVGGHFQWRKGRFPIG
ncbi:acyltransferase domain-containing protein [Dactylosporangium sp. CA-152071]|uniref:acyltransferase domain-containing protein n=1 Tax=Dactylosporangium sp. CA-152071 TaxID=3239933 RepID=UPI003D92BD03